MSDAKRVVVSKDLAEFFRQEVVRARTDLGVSLPELTEYYLVNLLCDFTRSGADPKAPGGEPLAIIYRQATEASPDKRVTILKQLGDVSLYTAGFFTDFIERSLVDVDYYVSMGGAAYHDLAILVGSHRHGDTFADLYGHMSKNFTVMVDLLNEIAGRSFQKNNGDADLLRLYDRYARTGSERIRKMLRTRGLLPSEATGSLEYIQ